MSHFCPNGGHALQVFWEKTRPNLLTVLELNCLLAVVQVFVFPADSVGSVLFWMTQLFVHIISSCQQIRRLSVDSCRSDVFCFSFSKEPGELFPPASTHYAKPS